VFKFKKNKNFLKIALNKIVSFWFKKKEKKKYNGFKKNLVISDTIWILKI
jgi:hypothetical protein